MPAVLPAYALPLWAWVLLVAAALLALIAIAQGKLLFGRTWRIRRADPGPAAARRVTEAVALARPRGVVLRGWACTTRDTPPRRLLLWLGGRNEHVAWTPDLAGWLPDDVALVAFNYRSLGGSGGWPSEAACVADAEAIARWACDRFELPHAALHLAGRSLGSGIALQLAARWPPGPASLFLLSPPQSIRALLQAQPLLRPLVALLRSPLDSVAAAQGLSCPVLMLLAEHDRRVPHAHSHVLAEALRRAGAAVDVQVLPGTTHRNLARTPAAMARLGSALCRADSKALRCFTGVKAIAWLQSPVLP